MTENIPKTPCECPLVGYCNRHKVNKTSHLHKLCQNHMGYFKMWEECRGPGQEGVDCNKLSATVAVETPKEIQEISAEQKKMPGLFTQIKNAASAAVKHIATGGGRVDPSIQENRLSICYACPLYNKESGQCMDCGCFLKIKTSLPSSRCPKGHW